MPKETNEIELLLSCKATGREQLEMFTEGTQKADAQANQLLGTLGRFATVGGIAMFAKKSIQAFSDLEETTSKFRVVFAGLEKQADAAVQSLTKSYGASILSARQMLSGTGDLLTGFGFDKQTALELSEQAAKLGSDLASFSNYAGGAEGATMALTKAMLGETEQAKMLGIVIRQDDEEYKKLFKEIKASTGATDAQTKALVTMRLAYKQSPNAIGDFERTMRSIANRGRMLENEMVQAYANIGEHLSGQYNALQGFGLDLLKTFNSLDNESRRFIVIAGETAGAMLALKTANSLRVLVSSAANKATAGSIAMLSQENAVIAKNTALYNQNSIAKNKRMPDYSKVVNTDTEKLKTLAKTKSDNIRIASEQRRHYLELKNAALEAKTVASVEAQKLASYKSRVLAEEAINEKVKYQHTLLHGSSKDYKEIPSLTSAKNALKEQEIAYQKSVTRSKEASEAAEKARIQTLKLAEAAKQSGIAYQEQKSAIQKTAAEMEKMAKLKPNTNLSYSQYYATESAKKVRSSSILKGESPIKAEILAAREYNKQMEFLSIRSKAAADALQIRNHALSLGASRAEANALTRAFIAQQKPIILAQERLARMPGILQKVHAGFVSANSAVKGMAISVAGLAKSFAPMLVMGVAMAGIDRLWRSDEISNAKILRGKEVETNRTISKNESRVAEMEKERKMLEEYYNLAKLPDRDKTQNERLSSITDELTKKYSFLNLERADGNKVLDISIEKQKEMLRLLEQQHKLEKGVMAKENALAYEDQAKAILKSMEVNTFAQGAKTVLKDLWDNMFSLNPDMARTDLASFVNTMNFSDLKKLTEARDMALAGGLDEEAEKFTKIIDLIKKANELRKSGTLEEQKKRAAIAAATAEEIKALNAYKKSMSSFRFDLLPSEGSKIFSLVGDQMKLEEEKKKYLGEDGKVKKDAESVKRYYEIEKQLYEIKLKRFKLELDDSSKPFNQRKSELEEIQNIYSRFGGDELGRSNVVKLQKEQLENYAKEIKRLTDLMNDDSSGQEKQVIAQKRLLDLTKERANLEKNMAIDAFAEIQKRIEAQAQFSSEIFKLMNTVKTNTVEAVSAKSVEAMRLQNRSFTSDRWQSTALRLQKDTANHTDEIKKLVTTIKSINSELNTNLLQILSKVDLLGFTTM